MGSDARYPPSSSSFAYTVAGSSSTCSELLSTSRTSARSSAVSALGCGLRWGGLRFQVSTSAGELRLWGMVLHNCLGDFAPTVASGRSWIIGIEVDEAIIGCVEMETSSRAVRQILGDRNRPLPRATKHAVLETLEVTGILRRSETFAVGLPMRSGLPLAHWCHRSDKKGTHPSIVPLPLGSCVSNWRPRRNRHLFRYLSRGDARPARDGGTLWAVSPAVTPVCTRSTSSWPRIGGPSHR